MGNGCTVSCDAVLPRDSQSDSESDLSQSDDIQLTQASAIDLHLSQGIVVEELLTLVLLHLTYKSFVLSGQII